MRVLCVGNINQDILFPLPRLPRPREKMTCSGARFLPGGSAANTACWLGLWGLDTAMAGAVGRDAAGQAQLESLAAAGVDVSGVERVEESTGVAVVFFLGEDKRMVRSPGANLLGSCRPRLLEGRSLLYLSGSNGPLLAEYGAAARERGVTVCYGPAGRGEGGLLELADWVVLNDRELEELTGRKDPALGLAELGRPLAAVTLEGGGCLLRGGDVTVRVEAPSLRPLDRTGGGDAFCAGFIRGMLAGEPLERCGERGNRLAAMVIGREGARPPGLSPPLP